MRDKILSFIKEKGPIVPTDLSSFLRMDSVIVSAYLSELVSSKLVKISSIKFGTSPLYYLPEQKKMLEEFTSNLNQPEKQAFDELKDKKVLREENLLPAIRVAIKNLKDFAIPLEVSFQDKKEVFWKWYEMSNEEASPVIKDELYGKKSEEIEVERRVEPVNETLKKVVQAEIEKRSEETIEEKSEKEEPKEKEAMKEEVKKEEKKEPVKKETKKEEKVVEEKIDKKEKSIAEFTDDKFAIKVIEYLKEKDVKILSLEVEKKNSEINMVVEVPTPVGGVTFYCKAKDKKRLSDVDVSSAFGEGYIKKLPVLLVSPGNLTKKGIEKLEKDFKSVVFLQAEL